MASSPDDVAVVVRDSVQKIVSGHPFLEWLSAEKAIISGDLVYLNNSFVFRDRVSTNKSFQYLVMPCNDDGTVNIGALAVARPSNFNVDFKRFSAKSETPIQYQQIKEAIPEQLSQMGRLVFLLVGAIDDNVTAEVAIDHELFSALRFEPASSEFVRIDNADIVVVRELQDIERVWKATEECAKRDGLVADGLPDGLVSSFAVSFERLQEEARSMVRLPTIGVESTGQTILGKLTSTLTEHCDEYETSLAACGVDPQSNRQAFNNMLRLAYNFSGDATRFIELLMSICDIKPIVMWCTIADHYRLAMAFRALPWAKSKKKPMLSTYETTISGARNRAFHDLFPFQRSIEVDVSGLSLRARRLLLFPPYAKRKGNALEYEDEELVDLLTQFTRAPETVVSFSFWERNLEVMRASRDLLKATHGALQMLLGALPATPHAM